MLDAYAIDRDIYTFAILSVFSVALTYIQLWWKSKYLLYTGPDQIYKSE